jgi:hypothetical protein
MSSHTPRTPSIDTVTDEGTVETVASSPSPRRTLSIVEEVGALSDDEEPTATPDGLKDALPKPPTTAPLLDTERNPRPESALATASVSDAASTRSLPLLHPPRPTTPAGTSSRGPSPVAPVPPSPARSRHSTAEEPSSARDARRGRHRSTLDVCVICVDVCSVLNSQDTPSAARPTGEQPIFRFSQQPRPS